MTTDDDRHLAPLYVTGLLEGQGMFTYSRSGANLTLVFGIRLTARDRPLLERVRSFFGQAGRIYLRPPSSCYYRVTRPRELLRIVEHFEAHPLEGERRRLFETWREMVFLRATYHGSRAPAELEQMARELSEIAQRRADH
jgi:hypothetical protein